MSTPVAGEPHVSSRRKVTRDRLKEAATAIFAERGIAAASVEEISERAGFTRGAFYSNFDSKEALYLEVLNEHMDQEEQNLSAALRVAAEAHTGSRHDFVTRALREFAGQSTKDREHMLATMEFQLHAARHPEVGARYRAIVAEMYDRIAALIDETLPRLGLRLRIDTRDFVQIGASVHMWSMITHQVAAGGPDDPSHDTILEALVAYVDE